MRDQNTVVIKNEDLLTFVSGLPGGTLRYCVKDEPVLDYVSDGMLDILGCTREEFSEHYKSGTSFLFQESDYSWAIGTFPYSIEDSMYVGSKEHRVYTYNGEEKWVKSRILRIQNPIGENWIYIQMEDIQKEKQEELLGENNNISEFPNYKKEPSCWNYENSSTAIVSFACELLAKTRDVSSAMKALLEKIGICYGASMAGIVEIDTEVQVLTNSYTWTRDKQVEPAVSFRNWSVLEQYVEKNSTSGLLVVSDWGILPDAVKGIFYDAKGVLLSGFYEESLLKGYVLLKDREKSREWTKEEIQGFLSLSRIISFYLLRIRVTQTIEKKMEYIKNYDGLTGLPSIEKFREIAAGIIKQYPQTQYAIVYSDISNFRYINDFFGYQEGDRILCDYASFLTAPGLSDVAVSRISSDNFVALVPFDEEKEFRKKVLCLNEEFCRQQKERLPNINLGIISGVCVIPPYQKDIMVAVDNANIARKSVKGSSKWECEFFDEPMQRNIIKKLDITNSMEEALVNREFIVHLQPKILLGDNSIVGAEALVRWRRKSGLMLPPDDFIPLFEKNGFIVNLDFYVYEEVCKMLRKWIDQNMTVIPVSVNVSRVHLNDESFVSKVKALAEKYNLPTRLLELELTETIFLNNTEVAISMMRALREAGFGVSIDDFGAGYSSLSLLKDMTTDVLKLDKEFFGHGEMQKEEQIIVSSIISMAKQLNMKVLSEGVETEIQSDFLKNIFCDMAQGFLFAKPMPVAEFELLLKKNQVVSQSERI